MTKRKYLTISYHFGNVPIEDFDKEDIGDLSLEYDIEAIILRLENIKEIELLLLKYLGYDHHEISDIIKLRNDSEYYVLWKRLRENVKKIQDNSV